MKQNKAKYKKNQKKKWHSISSLAESVTNVAKKVKKKKKGGSMQFR